MTFAAPVSSFGGNFGTNSGDGESAFLDFYDADGGLVDSVVLPMPACGTWEWQGWDFSRPVASITTTFAPTNFMSDNLTWSYGAGGDDETSVGLKTGGECPGPADLGIRSFVGEDLVGSGPFMVIAGDREGSTVVPGGRCAGTELGVESDGALAKFGPLADLDGDGMIDLTPTLPPGMCDKQIQVLDLATCDVSEVRTFGSEDGPDEGAVLTEWTAFDFADNGHKDGCVGGEKYIINSVRAGSEDLYIGATLCTDRTYKLWMSDSIYGTFTSMRETCGVGEDHCAHIGGTWDAAASIWDSDDESSVQGWYDCGSERPVFDFFATNAWGPTVYACSVSIP